jgi:hypothetical protein
MEHSDDLENQILEPVDEKYEPAYILTSQPIETI